jgi:hypothetical protein
MPVIITKNYSVVGDGIANGKTGTVYGFCFEDGDDQEFDEVFEDVGGERYKFLVPVRRGTHVSVLPRFVLVKVDNAHFQPLGIEGLPDDVYPIPAYTSDIVRCFEGENAPKYTARMVQMGLVVAFAKTVHKVQGATLDHVVVGDYCKRRDAGASFYVSISRPRTYEGLFLRQRFTDQVARICHPLQDVRKEMHRLELLEENPQAAAENYIRAVLAYTNQARADLFNARQEAVRRCQRGAGLQRPAEENHNETAAAAAAAANNGNDHGGNAGAPAPPQVPPRRSVRSRVEVHSRDETPLPSHGNVSRRRGGDGGSDHPARRRRLVDE